MKERCPYWNSILLSTHSKMRWTWILSTMHRPVSCIGACRRLHPVSIQFPQRPMGFITITLVTSGPWAKPISLDGAMQPHNLIITISGLRRIENSHAIRMIDKDQLLKAIYIESSKSSCEQEKDLHWPREHSNVFFHQSSIGPSLCRLRFKALRNHGTTMKSMIAKLTRQGRNPFPINWQISLDPSIWQITNFANQ